jgi:Peptidase MA superfamily
MPRYDASPSRFLPVICALFSLLLALLPASAGAAQDPGAVGSPPAATVAVVGVGSGEVSPEVLGRVDLLVASQLHELRPVFPQLVLRPFFVRVHESRASMPETLSRFLHPGSAGFALLGQHQIHLVWGEMRVLGSDPRGVVTHELVHELLDQMVAPYGHSLPRWFHEGLAQHLAGDTYLGGREEDLLWRLAARRSLSFAELRQSFPIDPEDLQAAYAQSYSYVAWLVRQFGIETLLQAARNVDRETSFEAALVGGTRRTTLQLEDGWRYHLHNESGAPWRVLLDQCFNILLLASLPLLVLAVRRRLARERHAAERLARSEDLEPVAALPESDQWSTPPWEPEPVPGPAPAEPPPPASGADERSP